MRIFLCICVCVFFSGMLGGMLLSVLCCLSRMTCIALLGLNGVSSILCVVQKLWNTHSWLFCS